MSADESLYRLSFFRDRRHDFERPALCSGVVSHRIAIRASRFWEQWIELNRRGSAEPGETIYHFRSSYSGFSAGIWAHHAQNKGFWRATLKNLWEPRGGWRRPSAREGHGYVVPTPLLTAVPATNRCFAEDSKRETSGRVTFNRALSPAIGNRNSSSQCGKVRLVHRKVILGALLPIWYRFLMAGDLSGRAPLTARLRNLDTSALVAERSSLITVLHDMLAVRFNGPEKCSTSPLWPSKRVEASWSFSGFRRPTLLIARLQAGTVKRLAIRRALSEASRSARCK